MKKEKKGLLFALCLLLAAAFTGRSVQTACFRFPPALPVDMAPAAAPEIILDAGHGGIDGGCVGIGGTAEKDLNLAVALRLGEMFSAAGIRVLQTRTEDTLVLKEEEDVAGKRKACDLRNRVTLANENPDAIFFSIHMNSFPKEKYKGFQVYYAPGDGGSEILAAGLQETVCRYLQPDNNRKEKKADSSIYVLDKAKGRAVLLECGFLSNREEEANLNDVAYQKRLCFLLLCATMEKMDS